MARPDKKSESLEIRIPHALKCAFMARCRADGTSASATVRGFIADHVAAPRGAGPRRWLRLAAGATAALGLTATALPSLAGSVERAGFDRLDADRDGALAPAEFARDAKVTARVDGRDGLPTLGAGELTLDARDGELRSLILRAAFARLDQDRDGALSFDEYRRR
jgi:hypothetical protein